MSACGHCGTEFSPARAGENFCCQGCAFVADLIRKEGFDRFYDLQDGAVGQPVRDRPFQPEDLEWLETRAAEAESRARQTDRDAELLVRVRGISCVGCVWLIEKVFLRREGGLRADLFPASGKLHLAWQPGTLSLPDFARELQRFGYKLEPWREDTGREEERSSLVSRTGLCGAFALNGMIFTLPRYLGMDDDFALAGIFSLVTLLSATLTVLVGGSYFFRRALAALRHGMLHMDLPISLGIALAYAGSLLGWLLGQEALLYFDFVAVFTFLMLGGRVLQESAVARSRHQMVSDAPLPDSVAVPDGGSLPLDQISPGTEYEVAGGGILPVSSFLAGPGTEFSLAWITGEPAPLNVPTGRRVAAGAINLSRQPVRLRADESWTDSLVSALTRESAETGRNPGLERILRAYLAVVLLCGLLGALGWSLASGSILTGLQVAIATFVVSCPCALGVALPLLDQRASSALQQRGVFVRVGSLWSRLPRIRHLLLDKTGTLTLEHPQLENPEVLARLPAEQREALATLAGASLHPLSRSLLEALAGSTPPRLEPTVTEVPGRGTVFVDHSGRWSLGRPGWTGQDDDAAPPETTDALACELRLDGVLLARFSFTESVRPDARTAIEALSGRLACHVLSGDTPSRVKQQAAALGIPPNRAHGGLSPTDKEALVKKLDRRDTLFLGDGANDSLAFDAAHACGTPVADRSVLDSKADFFFTSRGLGFLPALFTTASRRARAARRVFGFAVLYNALAIAICLAGWMTPLLAAILMPISSLLCLGIAARARIGGSN